MKNLYSTNIPKNNHFLAGLLLALLLASTSLVKAADPFVPGAGGSLPTFTEFQPVEGKVGGFLIYSSVRNNAFGGGTHAEVNMSFPNAAAYETESIVLQYKKNDGSWASYLNGNDVEVTTTGDNFSLPLNQSYTFRLLLRGGAKNGYVSNEQTAALSSVDTYFSSVSMDESMFLTGVMVPWVGRGLQVSFTAKKLSDNTEISGGLTYQWYRVNPVTFEKTPISGATGLTYTTTNDDLGYKLLAEAKGNETTVGGFYQMMSGSNTVSPNKCYVSNPSATGFGLMLYYNVAKLDTGDLILRDKDWVKVPITSVFKGAADGVFRINASLSLDKSPYYLQNKSYFWRICTEMVFGPMHDLMEGVNIDLAASSLNQVSDDASLKLLFEPSVRQIRFVSNSTVKTVSILSLNGTLLDSQRMDQNEGSVSVGRLTPGLYLARFDREDGSLVRKILVTK